MIDCCYYCSIFGVGCQGGKRKNGRGEPTVGGVYQDLIRVLISVIIFFLFFFLFFISL